jgi:plasmid stabilization system protein ParE
MSRRSEIIWSPAAEEDFRIVLNYLQEQWNQQVINTFIDTIDDTIILILKEPKIFPLINRELQIRKCVLTKQNTLYYRESNKGIEIIRLFDSRQDPKKLQF